MIFLDIHARTANADLWQKSDVLSDMPHKHNPFLVFFIQTETNTVNVRSVNKIEDVLLLPDDTQLLWQWPGNFASDFFRFNVGELRQAKRVV